MFGKNFLTNNNFELHAEYPDIQLTVYKNKTHLLGVDENNTFGSIHLVKNKKNFNHVLETIKKNFSCHLKNNNSESKLKETDQEKKERQERELETKHQDFLNRKK